MISSGITAITTASDTAVDVLTLSGRNCRLLITNGAVAGFFSVDNGTTWAPLPASTTLTLYGLQIETKVQVKRIAGGSNLAGVYAAAW